MDDIELRPGAVVWAVLDPVRGREQSGHRPCLVVASQGYLATATTLALVAPITSVGRGWPNHVEVDGRSGLRRPSWIMPEQTRAISRDRITGVAGDVTGECLIRTRVWLRDFFDL